MPIPNYNVPNDEKPAVSAVAVTPSDSVNLASVARGLYIGTAGNVAAVMPDGDVILFQNAPAGGILPVRVARVNATNTTASNIVALY